MQEDIMVSVYLITYNHEIYIRQALDSILSQKTDFAYEVIVHDDASTDGTTEIVQEYARKYPEIIVPVIQKENQYSKKIDIYKTFIMHKIRGKYIAGLEGDDYWCDENKLQKQVDFLENHSEYSACVHNSTIFDCRTNSTKLMNVYTDNRDIQLQDILENGNHSFHLSSILYRSKLDDSYPEFMEIPKGLFGDLSLRLFLICSGKIRYFAKPMSVYRYFSVGSWTSNTQDVERRKKIYQAVIELYKAVNEFQGKEHDDIFQKYIKKYQFLYYEVANEFSKLISEEYKEQFKERSFCNRLFIRFCLYFPKGYQLIKKLNKLIK